MTSAEAIAREIDRGAKEIVLTGVDITDYEGGLGRLCRQLLKAEPRMQRLRLSSLDSIEIDDELFEAVQARLAVLKLGQRLVGQGVGGPPARAHGLPASGGRLRAQLVPAPHRAAAR